MLFVLRWRIVASLFAAIILPGLAWSAEIPMVAASADMALALKEISNSFTRQTTLKVNIVLGASDTLAQQINDGVATELFLSADEAAVTSLRQRGKAIDEGVIYGIGRIALFDPTKKKGQVALPNLAALKEALEQGKIKRIAISMPERCPYGRAAREALQNADIWNSLGDKLIIADDAAQAAELAFSGKVDAAILPLSLVISPLAKSRGAFFVIDVKAHRSLKQRMVLVAGAGSTAKAFYNYMQAPVAREALRRYGYTFPMR